MPYISADGTVGGKPSLMAQVFGFFGGIFSLISLFFATIAGTQAIENNRASNSRTYGERNRGKSYRSTGPKKPGSNIRQVNRLGNANCAVGGG
mmetsp:Transcript_895/g.1867  ORF Transcript_895/g.1867 Transcript_895/m.1867 type:complete len:93 (-) Transcript_895:115-393(-)